MVGILIALRTLGLLGNLLSTSTFMTVYKPPQNPAGEGCDGRMTKREREAETGDGTYLGPKAGCGKLISESKGKDALQKFGFQVSSLTFEVLINYFVGSSRKLLSPSMEGGLQPTRSLAPPKAGGGQPSAGASHVCFLVP